MIWFRTYDLKTINGIGTDTMIDHLGIEITQVGEDWLEGTLPVDKRVVQPARLLHGGASATLAETLGSVASFMVINPEKYQCVGLELNINHIRGVVENSGKIKGIAKAIHLGKSTHIWNIEITGPENKLVAVSRLTMAILEKKS